ncbi:MAG: TetR/AcrR family transcriptional regulator [Gudongella sp.]|nr:TetR/AcrR family transcriptional regulator [Gudongella sp.]
MNSRSLQAKKTKERIYKASIRLFNEHGFENVKIKDIAKHAGVSVGSFYNYYESKQDIFIQPFVEADSTFTEYASKGIEGSTAKEKIKSYMMFYIDFVLSHPYDFIKVLYNNNNAIFVKKGRAMQELLNPLIDEAVERQEISCRMSTEEINEFLFQAMRGLIFHWCLNDGEFNLHKRASEYLDLYIKAL